MEQRMVSGRIPGELHELLRREMEAKGWTMSHLLELVITEHFEDQKGGKRTMENTRTLAFAVSEEFFQKVKEYLAWYEEVYHRRLTQKEFVVGLIEDELERNEQAMAAWRAEKSEAARQLEEITPRTEDCQDTPEDDEGEAAQETPSAPENGPVSDEEDEGGEQPEESENAPQTEENTYDAEDAGDSEESGQDEE